MKIKISYTKVVEEELEVDDKFLQLTEEGGYDELSYTEQERLTEELADTVVKNTDAWYHDIVTIETEAEEILFGN